MRKKKEVRKPEFVCKEFETPGIRDTLKIILSSDNKFLCLLNYTKSIIKVFDLKSKKVVHTLVKFCDGYIGRMESKSAVFYDSKTIAMCWSNRDIFFVDIDSDKIIKKFTGPFENQSSIQFTEDSRFMISCAKHGEIGIDGKKASICAWDISTSQLIHRIEFKRNICSVNLARDSRTLYICFSTRELEMWDLISENKTLDLLKDYPE